MPLGLSISYSSRIIGLLYCLKQTKFYSVGNLIAASYFATRRKDLPTLLYVFTTVTDATLIFFSLVAGLCFFFDRRPLLFDYHWFCYMWSLVFHSLQYFSIFLVAVLSLSRTWSLLRPLSLISKKKVLICGK